MVQRKTLFWVLKPGEREARKCSSELGWALLLLIFENTPMQENDIFFKKKNHVFQGLEEKRGGDRRRVCVAKSFYHRFPLWGNPLDAPPPGAQVEAVANNPLFSENKNQFANVKVESEISWISKQPSGAPQPRQPRVQATALWNPASLLCSESPAISRRVKSIRGHLLWKRCYHWGRNLCKEILWLGMIKLRVYNAGISTAWSPSGGSHFYLHWDQVCENLVHMVWDLKKKIKSECFHMSLCIFEVERTPPWLGEGGYTALEAMESPFQKKKKSAQKGLFLRLPGMKPHIPLHFKWQHLMH